MTEAFEEAPLKSHVACKAELCRAAKQSSERSDNTTTAKTTVLKLNAIIDLHVGVIIGVMSPWAGII